MGCPRRLVVLILASAASSPLSAQIDGAVLDPPPPSYANPGIWEWLDLEPTPGVRSPFDSKVWLGVGDEGLVVAGRVRGEQPRWPTTAESVGDAVHFEVAVALAPTLDPPPIGWGNQFGPTELASEDECRSGAEAPSERTRAAEQQCVSWFRDQALHRSRLRRLFLRHWLLAAGPSYRGFVREVSASPAFAELDVESQIHLDVLDPHRLRRGASSLGSVASGATSGSFAYGMAETAQLHPRLQAWRWPQGEGFDFEIVVPWAAMPPARENPLEEMFLRVALRDGGGRDVAVLDLPASSEEGTWSRVRLRQPREVERGACRDTEPSWYFPGASARVDLTFVLANQAGGYWYEPRGLSPGVELRRHVAMEVGPGTFVCGPHLALWMDGARVPFRATRGEAAPLSVTAGFDARATATGTRVLVGPRSFFSRFGSGQCGACPRIGATLYDVGADSRAVVAFEWRGLIDPPRVADADIHVNDDWTRFEVYVEEGSLGGEAAAWTRTSYCARDAGFVECGKAQEAPPERRVTPNVY